MQALVFRWGYARGRFAVCLVRLALRRDTCHYALQAALVWTAAMPERVGRFSGGAPQRAHGATFLASAAAAPAILSCAAHRISHP